MNRRHQKILVELLSLPTAPFTESAIQSYISKFCARKTFLRVRQDAVGNILVHYRHPQARRQHPVCLCAHMDHPGFRTVRMIDSKTLKAQWHGGVAPEFFPKAKVRFFTSGQWIHGQIVRTEVKTLGLEKPQPMVHTVEVIFRSPQSNVLPGSPGMWDFSDPTIRKSMIHARGCDDIAGCGAILACIDTLVRQKAKTEAYFLFTRAEEVGFIGAIAACRLKTIPRKCSVVAVETSSVRPGVVMGGGPILRVGDKSSIFNPDLTAWCGQIADQLAQQDKSFIYQRKLMDGGTCESSAYCQLGYHATGLCIALGNYHNVDRKKNRLAPEYVHLRDWENLTRWFLALVTTRSMPAKGDPRLENRILQLERRYKKLLLSTTCD